MQELAYSRLKFVFISGHYRDGIVRLETPRIGITGAWDFSSQAAWQHLSGCRLEVIMVNRPHFLR